MRFREARTIKAIGQLRRSFPYAASLLSCVVVERVLKRYLLEHFTDPRYADATIPNKVKGHGGKPLSALKGLSRKQRLANVVCRMTLGEVEAVLKRPEKEKSAADRNEVMHSNLYLKSEASLNRRSQQLKNQARFAKALEHLRRALDQFADHRIVGQRDALA